MRKSEKNKTDKFNQIGKRIEKLTDLYDNTGRDDVIVDGNELKLESQLRKEIEQRERRKVSNWQLMKEVAQDKARKGNTKELNDLLKIERKMRKKTNTAQRTAPKEVASIVPLPLNLKGYGQLTPIVSEPDDTLKRIERDRIKSEKEDRFNGLGSFFYPDLFK